MKKKQYIYTILTLVWAFVIFSFSLQPADVSGGLSSGITQWIVDTFLPGFENVEQLSFLFRKCAHFTEFFVLGCLAYKTFGQTKLSYKMIWAIFFCVAIASMDETIQLFVDGRAGRIADVILDSCGALTGIGIMQLVCKRVFA